METSNSKWITVSFMAAGILVGITASVLLETLIGLTTGSISRFMSADWFRHGVPVLLGVIVFSVAQFNPKIMAWADDVVTELKRIVWPSRKDTMSLTLVVCIMLIISGIFLGLLDFLSGTAVDWLVHVNLAGII